MDTVLEYLHRWTLCFEYLPDVHSHLSHSSSKKQNTKHLLGELGCFDWSSTKMSPWNLGNRDGNFPLFYRIHVVLNRLASWVIKTTASCSRSQSKQFSFREDL